MEKSGSLVLAQLLAGADERVHVPMAPLEEHVRPRLAQKNLHYLVDVLMGAQHEVRGQGLLIPSDVENLQKREGTFQPKRSISGAGMTEHSLIQRLTGFPCL